MNIDMQGSLSGVIIQNPKVFDALAYNGGGVWTNVDPSLLPVTVKTDGVKVTGQGTLASPVTLGAGTADTFLSSDGATTTYRALAIDPDCYQGNGVSQNLQPYKTSTSLSFMQAQTIASGTTDVAILSDNPASGWINISPATGWSTPGIFTVPSRRPGWYRIGLNITYPNNGTGKRVAAISTTTAYGTTQQQQITNAVASSNTSLDVNTLVYLAVGETFRFYTQQNSGSPLAMTALMTMTFEGY